MNAIEKERFKAKLAKMKERLDEVQDDAGQLMLERDSLLEEMAPLQAVIANIDYKLSMLSQTNDQLLKQYTRHKRALEEMERNVDMSVY